MVEAGQQTELLPLAVVRGEPLLELPFDLYIPPDALEVFLEAFEGPLDLLLYLIRKQNLDVVDIPIAEITRQYVSYVELMKTFRLELAADYLVMAAMLAEIKSRLLLPRSSTHDATEDDPRAELVRRLQEYEQIKQAAEVLDVMPQIGRDIFLVSADAPVTPLPKILAHIELTDLLAAMQDVLKRCQLRTHHQVRFEAISIRERMSAILARLTDTPLLLFSDCFTINEGRLGVVVSFIAILELLKQSLIKIDQREAFAPIYIAILSSAEFDLLHTD